MLKGAYNITFSLIDKGLLEVAGPTGGGKLTHRLGTLLARCQTGNVYEYAAAILLVILLALLAGKYTFLTVLLQNSTPFDITTQLSFMLTVKKVTSFTRTLLGNAIKKARLLYKGLVRSASKISSSGTRRITSRKRVLGQKTQHLLF